MASTWTLTDLAKLEQSIAQGVTSVAYTDRKVEYRSLDEMLQIRNLIRNELGLNPAASQRVYARFSKGLNGQGR